MITRHVYILFIIFSLYKSTLHLFSIHWSDVPDLSFTVITTSSEPIRNLQDTITVHISKTVDEASIHRKRKNQVDGDFTGFIRVAAPYLKLV